MATYYNYAEREADSQINWAEIGKNLSDTLTEVNVLREQKKAAIDESTREFTKTLANAPQGENGLVNQRTLDYANNATEMMLMQERLLKSGQMKFKDYATVRQNLVDSTEQAFGLSKEYQEEYKIKMERMQSDDPATASAALEQWQMEQLEGYANLETMNFYIDPTSGNVSMGKVLKKTIDGKTVDVMDDNPNNYVSVNTARNRLKTYYNKYDVDKTLNAAAASLGTNIEAVRKAGGSFRAGEIITTTDVTKKKDVDGAINLYNEAEKNFISASLANDFNMASVLTDHEKFDPATGEAYTFTYNPEEQASNVILLKNVSGKDEVDKNGKFYKDQYGVAEKHMQQQLRIRLDREVKRDTYQEPSNYAPEYAYNAGRGAADEKKQKSQDANMLGLLYYGNPSEIQAATTYFGQRDPSIKKMYRWNNVIKVVREEKDSKGLVIRELTETIPLRDINGQPLSQERFIQGASPKLTGYTDILTGLEAGSYDKGRSISNASGKEGIGYSVRSSEDKPAPSATKSEWKKAGWTDAQINQAVKAGKIKVI
jgi:hypothetical protein